MRFKRLLPDPFLMAILCAVAIAFLLPARGGFAPVAANVSTAAIMLLFFLHGIKLPREALFAAVTHWRLHLTILGATFVLFPLAGLALALALPGALPAPLWTGILFLCALPSTVQSSIGFTSIARGNVAGAVAAAAASNLIGVFATPALIGLMVRTHGAGMPIAGVGRIVIELFVPFVAGHLLRPWLAAWIGRHKPLAALVDRGTIVIAVYSAFSAAVIEGLWRAFPLIWLIVILLLSAVLLLIVMLATWHGGRALGFSRADRITILFCGSKKSLASGVPMAKIMFAGPVVGMTILPLMIFHQMQLMACAAIARRLARGDAKRDDGDADGGGIRSIAGGAK